MRELAQVFDAVHGGIGRAPKFPHPAELAYCLRRHALEGDDSGLAIARLTLAKMAEGGIYDQLGGGFCRYSVDQYWAIPHFEKMLYDNAALLPLYADAWLVTGLPAFERVARDTVRWLEREMLSPEGAFYSSLDADSEHEEGKFYVWTPAEVRALVTPEEYAVIEAHYGLGEPPNFEGRAWHFSDRAAACRRRRAARHAACGVRRRGSPPRARSSSPRGRRVCARAATTRC